MASYEKSWVDSGEASQEETIPKPYTNSFPKFADRWFQILYLDSLRLREGGSKLSAEAIYS
jgi:hypothetical protein